ncbi:hypothetical protein [Streptomyces sp. S186]|uniref:hypothetical protein n=1 Tax=Streptomyces sp. S186 TaxID=3434395 RepID=UPI003F67E8C1
MSADADYADAPRIPPIPPRPPHRPSRPPADLDPQTTVLRPVPADPDAPPPAAPPAPPRPRPEPPTAPPRPAGAPRSFRDTAAFHLANSGAQWDAPRDRAASPPPPAAPMSRPPAPARLPGTRIVAAAAGLVLGIGLMAGAAVGSWLTDTPAKTTPTPEAAFTKGRDAWRNTPVDTLFPRTVEGLAAGPGGADRTWIRLAVAPDTDCTAAYEGPLAEELAPAGCARLLRATYVDATRTDVITVGAQTTKADRAGMMDLNARFSTNNLATRKALMPLPLAAQGTPAEDFGPAQRASWTVRILTDIPVVVYAVSGFADGREITDPQPADAAVQPGTATAPAESGLGHDAKGLADKISAAFRTASGIPAKPTEDAQ